MSWLNCASIIFITLITTDTHNIKNLELLKHFNISKTARTCFGLQGNHHQGTTISTN